MHCARVLGVGIDVLTLDEAVSRMLGFLEGKEAKHVVTPNNEMLVEACRNPAFRKVLDNADLAIPDSTGVAWACKTQRVPGVDAFTALCRALPAQHSVFLLGGAEGVAEKAAETLTKLNSSLRIAGTHAGSPRREEAHEIVDLINKVAPSLLLVAYGAPAQDLWIAEHLHLMPSVRVAAGVGGTLDFLAGTKKRAPALLRSAGLEWLWRLCIEPSRLPRILRATVVFPFLVLFRSKRFDV